MVREDVNYFGAGMEQGIQTPEQTLECATRAPAATPPGCWSRICATRIAARFASGYLDSACQG